MRICTLYVLPLHGLWVRTETKPALDLSEQFHYFPLAFVAVVVDDGSYCYSRVMLHVGELTYRRATSHASAINVRVLGVQSD